MNVTRQILVELVCLACGRDDQLRVDDLAHLPPLPRPCAHCAGSIVATGASVRLIHHRRAIDWSRERPRRGRPLKKRMN